MNIGIYDLYICTFQTSIVLIKIFKFFIFSLQITQNQIKFKFGIHAIALNLKNCGFLPFQGPLA